MAGQPRTTAKKIAALEETAFQLTTDLHELCPARYRKKPTSEDERHAAWHKALAATATAALKLNLLLGAAEEAAGLDFAELDMARDQRRGLLWSIEEAVATEGSETAKVSET